MAASDGGKMHGAEEGAVMQENRLSFHHELEEIRGEIVRLAAMVCEFIPRATEVLLATDMQGAQQLIEDDDDIDALSLAIEDQCCKVMALQQPMARDLRELLTALRLSSEIERSGDLMVNVAKAARRLYGTTFDPKLRGLVERMSEEAVRLYRYAIDAYAEGNAGLAAALDDMDDRLDELHNDYIQAIFESHHAGNLDLEAGVQLALIGRYYERVGDHAVNVAERVHYMVNGWLPEHTGAARSEVRARKAAPTDAAGAAADPTADDPSRPQLRIASPPDAASGG